MISHPLMTNFAPHPHSSGLALSQKLSSPISLTVPVNSTVFPQFGQGASSLYSAIYYSSKHYFTKASGLSELQRKLVSFVQGDSREHNVRTPIYGRGFRPSQMRKFLCPFLEPFLISFLFHILGISLRLLPFLLLYVSKVSLPRLYPPHMHELWWPIQGLSS